MNFMDLIREEKKGAEEKASISVSVDESLKAKLKEIGDKANLSLSKVVLKALIAAVAEYDAAEASKTEAPKGKEGQAGKKSS